MKHFFVLLAACVAGGSLCLAQADVVKHERIISFEQQGELATLSADHSTVALSSSHYKDGERSLEWDYRPGARLHIRKPIHYEPVDTVGKDHHLSSFIGWVYNPAPKQGSLKFEFLKEDTPRSWFDFHLDFKGWRAIWISFERDMQGTPGAGMDELRITAPDDKGVLFFDRFITGVKVDYRHHTPDLQQPDVNPGVSNHWLILLKTSQIRPDEAAFTQGVGPVQLAEMKSIEKRYLDQVYQPGRLTEAAMNAIRADFEKYKIEYAADGTLTGLPVYFVRADHAFERLIPDWKGWHDKRGMEVKDYFALMNRIAQSWHRATEPQDKEALAGMFLAMYDHATDQGICYGSGLGNISHYGYSFRGLYTSILLMKDVLRKAGKLDEAERTVNWYAQTNQVLPEPAGNGINIDILNTTMTGVFTGILLIEDPVRRKIYLDAFSRWLDYGCRPSPGLEGGFKPDGSIYHHRNNYPAYATGGLGGAVEMIYVLSRTSFAVSEEAHSAVKRGMLAMRFYSNKTNFPLAMSGRHPDGKGSLIPSQYGLMALAGTPDGKAAIDPQLGAAYLRFAADRRPVDGIEPKPLGTQDRAIVDKLTKAGIKPETDPNGNLAMGYACVSVQRREGWSAVVRGFSRYLWASEHYIGANLYGRYLAYGGLQVMTAPEGVPVTSKSSGWVQEGFDWGRIPGTTAIHLPVSELKAGVISPNQDSGEEEMLLSDEAFAGGLSQKGRNGNFGMKLHEHDKYNGSHRARKSYHFFDGVIVCLGSDIENVNGQYPTETTVFQLAVPDAATREFWGQDKPGTNYWIDHLGTGYYIPKRKENVPVFARHYPQLSRKQDTGKETSGDWVTLTLDHGKAPHGGAYEYAVLPGSTEQKMKQFATRPSYEVLQKDRTAHIVRSGQSTSFIFFETPQRIPSGPLLSVDSPCLVMLTGEGKSMTLTVCNPDLALYLGESDARYDKDGKRIEEGVYTRTWALNESHSLPLTVELKGKWNASALPSSCEVSYRGTEATILKFVCRDAASYDVTLVKE